MKKQYLKSSVTVCSLLFTLKTELNEEINIDIYPSNINIKTYLNNENNYSIGGEIYNLPKNNDYKMKRLTIKIYKKKILI